MKKRPKKKKQKPAEIVEVDTKRLDDVLDHAEGALPTDDYELTKAVFESYAYIADLVEDKNITIRRLREMLFGARTEKTAAVVGDTPDSEPTKPDDDSAEADALDEAAEDQAATAKKGHGRNGASVYKGAEQIEVPHATLEAGDACPACQQGTVYELSAPGVLVRIVGQAPLHARVYELQKLRCGLCLKIFTAEAPAEAGSKRYDATAASMIALLKYGSGLPFNRLAGLQGNLEIPLPSSTQWDVVDAFAGQIGPAFEELVRQAAQGDVLHNDDTTVKILALMGERAKQQAAKEEDAEAECSQRKGLFTSGVVSIREGQRVALFFSGRQHAGENLADVLKHRAVELQQPIQMCDALSRNLPNELKTIVANCLAHGRRKFVEIHNEFPDECRYVLEALKVIYRNDANARKQQLSAEKRLRHHRIKSQQTMDRLHQWMNRQLDEKLTEPNSALGEAIRYMLKHWEKLTLFLRQAGAPLDNNICERALKKAILHRKNALFYKTKNGARVGDLYMSLIHSCELCGANPFEYLVALQRHADELAANPELWMPWNYQAALDAQPAAA